MEAKEICINDVPNGPAVSMGRIDKKVETKAGDFAASQGRRRVGTGRHTGGRLALQHDEIAQLAHCLYESRGRRDDTEDWLRAEQQLLHHYA